MLMVRHESYLTCASTIQGDAIEPSVLRQASDVQPSIIREHASERSPTTAAAASIDAAFSLLLPFSRSATSVSDAVNDGRDPFASATDACEHAGHPEPGPGLDGGTARGAGPEPAFVSSAVVDVRQPEHGRCDVEAQQREPTSLRAEWTTPATVILPWRRPPPIICPLLSGPSTLYIYCTSSPSSPCFAMHRVFFIPNEH